MIMNKHIIIKQLVSTGTSKDNAEAIADEASNLFEDLRRRGFTISYNHKLLIAKTERFIDYDQSIERGIVLIGDNTRHIQNI